MMALDLPWPDRVLHPNARPHWAAKARAAKKARQEAAWAAKAVGIGSLEASSLTVTAIFPPPDKRRRDRDGMLSSIKSYLDGLSDVLGVDDSLWDIRLRREEQRPIGNVRIEIEVTP